MFSSPNPTLLVCLAHLVGVSTMTDHVRVNVHAPKERNRLDYQLIDGSARVTHLIPANVPYAEFLAENFTYHRKDPTPQYKLNAAAHFNFEAPGNDVLPSYTLALSIPVAKEDPKIKILTLGEIKVDGVLHNIIGTLCSGVGQFLKHPDRHSTVCYTLDTATNLESEELLGILRFNLELLGYATSYTSKE